jgi:predicted DNA-binding antitoxin AbrB/MazE fold protein
MISVMAVYENGVLRPKEPLPLAEGQTVSLTVAPAQPALSPEEWERQIRAAKTIQEWVALANASPNPETEFDVVKAMNETRRLSGFRMPSPETHDGTGK